MNIENTLLTNVDPALQIHSVEARHAAIVRKIGSKKPSDGAFDEPMIKEQVLATATPYLA
ncbi:MAG: ferritin-like protein [Devosia sp.]|nr:ferritin-like protein [Devosia sp.]